PGVVEGAAVAGDVEGRAGRVAHPDRRRVVDAVPAVGAGRGRRFVVEHPVVLVAAEEKRVAGGQVEAGAAVHVHQNRTGRDEVGGDVGCSRRRAGDRDAGRVRAVVLVGEVAAGRRGAGHV